MCPWIAAGSEMAMASWMIRGRSLRSNRSLKSRLDSEDNCVQLDLSKDIKENVQEVLTNLCQRQGISSVKKLAYLNAIVKLISENDVEDYGYCTHELFCCLRVGLINEATQVRAAALRAVRYMLKKEQDIVTLNKLQYPYLVARSMDLNLRNEIERIQALRLVRRILLLAPKHFSPALARSLISLTNGGVEEKDPIFRAFLAALCELGVLNSNLLISCGGVGALTRAAMTGQSPAITESVVGVLLKLLGSPETRNGVSLLCLAAPYCELHSSGVERTKEEREQRFAASKLALLSVLRSYTGIIHFCHPSDSSGLKAISGILYVEQLEVRGAVLELLYELLGLPLPAWTDEPDVALAAVDPSRPRESWKLSEGFVGAEGRSILLPLSRHRPNISELHLALLVYALLECGLHKALAETIVTSDTFISVRAAVLLGALLHLAHALLPAEACDLTPPLPNLLEHASAGRHQALAAVAILGRMHTVMRRRPAPASLFLDRVLQAGTWLRPTLPRRQRTTSRHWLRRESPTTPLLRDAHVLSSKDALAWNWPVVRSILRSRDDTLRKLQDSDHKQFIKRLVRYFKPSYNRYSRVELGTNVNLAREATLAGCDLFNCLLELHEPEGNQLLTELVGDIAEQISAIRTMQSAHDCLFSPRHMTTTCCQKYFLFLGQLSHSAKGTVVLNRFDLLEKLQDLALATNHDCYVKLITSSLDYSREGIPRKVFSKIIVDAQLESTRLYATQFLRVILRARMSDAHHWAIGLLWGRLKDASRTVALAALEALHEACDEVENLEVLFQQRDEDGDWTHWLDHLGDRGYLLKIKLYSLHSIFDSLPSPAEELEKWISPGGFSERYVGLVDGEIHDSLTRRQRGENGTYHRRSSQILPETHDVFIPPHLIGQLVQHDVGIELLLRRNVLHRFVHIILRFRMESGTPNTEISSKGNRGSRLLLEDGHLLSTESSTDDTLETSRLETIIDSEDMEVLEMPWRTSSPCKPWKTEFLVEIRRKSSFNDSRRTTPEKTWKGDFECREDRLTDIDGRILKVKSALWTLGHAGTSLVGVELLNNLGIIGVMATMAESCPHYSVRATAMYALSLIATTRSGADILSTYDWPCVRHKRGDQWPVVPPQSLYPVPSPVPVQRHHRSLSDGKPELSDPVIRRSRNRSESAATDLETRRYPFPERGDTPSPIASALRLSQQDADGYARLRSLQRHRRPSYSQSSLEMHSLDGRLSQLSFTDLEPPRTWVPEPVMAQTPPPENGITNQCYMGISLPRTLTAIFPDPPRPTPPIFSENLTKQEDEASKIDEELTIDNQTTGEHARICLVCDRGKNFAGQENGEGEAKLTKEILRHVERLANPVWYRNSRQALLRLRQQCPEKFQGTCLFSEVGTRLASGTYRMQARQFLQELFLESHFDALYAEPLSILQIPVGTEENPVHSIPPRSPLENVHKKPVSITPENKLNGEPKHSDLTLVEEKIPALNDGEFLIRTEYLAVDSHMRAYGGHLPLGTTLIGLQVAEIVMSKNKDLPVGRCILANAGWRTYTVLDAKSVGKFNDPPYLLPYFGNLLVSLSLGVRRHARANGSRDIASQNIGIVEIVTPSTNRAISFLFSDTYYKLTRGLPLRTEFPIYIRCTMVIAKKYVVAKHFEKEPKRSDLLLVDEELPALKDGEYLIQAEFLSVDPYMRVYTRQHPLGITMIGRQVSRIIESKNKDYPVGKHVVANVGWRSHTIVDPSSKEHLGQPPYMLPDYGILPVSLGLGVLGRPGNTAYFGLVEICQPKAGETLVVSGAAGAVGSHVGQIGKILGLKVIGIAGSDTKCKWLMEELGFDHAINYKTQDVAKALKEAAPNKVDCYFDNVGGEISTTVLYQMNFGGRVAVCGSISSYNAADDALPKCTIVQRAIINSRLRLEGFIVSRWDNRRDEGIQQNLQWVKEDKLKYRENVTEGFENMFDAFVGMLRGENIGKAVVKV